MKQQFFIFSLVICTLLGVSAIRVHAQVLDPDSQAVISADSPDLATDSALATESAIATPSARVEEEIQEKSQTDITQPQAAVKSRLAQVLDANPIGPLSPLNFIQHVIRSAVNAGVPANTLVLILMFPMVASLIAASRHMVGLQGFGIYTPAVLAVVFLSTGIITGVIVFVIIVLGAAVAKELFKFLKLEYLPRNALIVWFVSLLVFAGMVASPYLVSVVNLAALGIFPVLVLILLSENFLQAQLSGSRSKVLELTGETLLLAIGSALIMDMDLVQNFVILHPEVVIVAVAIIDVLVGKYTGLRLTEYFRFKPIIDEEE